MKKISLFNIRTISFALFGVILGLGIINPFNLSPDNYADDSPDNGVLVFQLFTVLFLGFLFLQNMHNRTVSETSFTRVNKSLTIFFILLVISSILYGIDTFPVMYVIKFALAISFCYLLPPILRKEPDLFYISMVTFSATCVAISLAFAMGYLANYVSIHNAGRIFIFNENANTTSARLALSIVFITYLVDKNPFGLGKWRKALFLLFIPQIALMFATASRGSFLILCLTMGIYIFLRYAHTSLKGIFKALLLIAFCGLGIFYLLTTSDADFSLLDRLLETYNTGSTGGREIINEQSLKVFEDNFVFGTGANGYKIEMLTRFNEERTAHNIFYHVLGMTGLLGFIPFVIFWFGLFKRSWKVRSIDELPLTIFSFMFLLSIKTGGIFAYLLMWYCLAFVNTFNNKYIRELKYEHSISKSTCN